MKPPKILVVDDESGIRSTLQGVLGDEGWETRTAITGEEALTLLEKESFDVVILDVLLPGKDGITLLKEIHKEYPSLVIIMISGHSTIEMAVKATRAGAFNFLEKPLSLEKVILTIRNAIDNRLLVEENLLLKQNLRPDWSLIGESPSMRRLKETIELVAPKESRVLIAGEKGTGKELVARAIHENSRRKQSPFLKVNFGVTPEEMAEEELLGYVKGAFPYAVADKKGKLLLADGGVLLLESVERMTPKLQATVLRYLEERRVEPLGSPEAFEPGVRLMATTTVDLSEEVVKGRFREDLLLLLGVVTIPIPPLRERKEDIHLLADHFLEIFAEEHSSPRKYFTDSAMRVLVEHPWFGNVRELKNLVERIVLLWKEEEVTEKSVRNLLTPLGFREPELITASYTSLTEAMESFERAFLHYRLKQNNLDQERTARSLGLDSVSLKERLQRFGLITGENGPLSQKS